MQGIMGLTAHNWQNWKNRFPLCPSTKIDREEAVGLKRSNYTFKKMAIFMNMWNLEQFRENLIFCR